VPDVEAALVAAIQCDPDDVAARAAAVDGLDERGDPRGERPRLDLTARSEP